MSYYVILVIQLFENVLTSTVPVSTIAPNYSSILFISFALLRHTCKEACLICSSIILSQIFFDYSFIPPSMKLSNEYDTGNADDIEQ
jgi:hypothetical protein